MTPLDFTDISARLRAWTFPEKIDGVVGIARGGVVPAALVAHRLGVGLKVLAVNYRDDAHEPRFAAPRVLECPVQLEAVVEDAMADRVVEAIANAAKTGRIGDGKIFVVPVEKAVRIRTGELDEAAI